MISYLSKVFSIGFNIPYFVFVFIFTSELPGGHAL